MSNPNSPMNRFKAGLKARWFSPDFPGGEPRFQLTPFGQDVGLFVLFPAVCVLMANAGSSGTKARRSSPSRSPAVVGEKQDLKPQIIIFGDTARGTSRPSGGRRAPGTLVRVRLLNLAETLAEVPVHAQILDHSLGAEFYGGTLLGDGAGEPNYSRMNIVFRFAKPRGNQVTAVAINARALSLDGTLGLEARKKEGMFARGVLGGAASSGGSFGKPGEANQSLQTLLLQALAGGLAKEFSEGAATARNNASVLTLEPGREFFAELKDFFPSGGR